MENNCFEKIKGTEVKQHGDCQNEDEKAIKILAGAIVGCNH